MEKKKKNKVQESYKGTTGNSVDRLSKGNGWKDKRGTRLPCPKKNPFTVSFGLGVLGGSQSSSVPPRQRYQSSPERIFQLPDTMFRCLLVWSAVSWCCWTPLLLLAIRMPLSSTEGSFLVGKRKPGTYFPWLIRNFSKDAVRILRCRRSWKAAAALTNESVRRRENEKGFQP